MFDQRIESPPVLSDQALEGLTAAEFASWDDSEQNCQVIPPDLDSWAPGPFLAAVLSSIDPTEVAGHEAVTVMRAHARQLSHDQAGYYRSVGGVATAVPTGGDGPPERSEEWYEYAYLEARAALTLTRRAADVEVGNVYELLERFPRLWDTLSSGLLDIRKTLTILRGIAHLDSQIAQKVVGATLPEAPELTASQLRTRIRRLCLEIDPEEAAKRTEDAVEERRFIIEPTTEGTAEIHGHGAPIDRAAAIGRRINGCARSLKNAGDAPPMDQIRMDVALDLLHGITSDETPGSGGGVVVHTTLETLARLSENPGDLAGHGPVHADIARQVADRQTDGSWSYVVTDEAGNLVQTAVARRRPTAAQKSDILALYSSCLFPGCPAPADECDIDHIDPFAEGGPTTVENNAPLCEPDHNGRHAAGLKHRRLPDGGHQFTSRPGHTYITYPDRPP